MAFQKAIVQSFTIPTLATGTTTPTTPTNPVVTISKDGAGLGAPAGVVTVIANYGIHLAATIADMTADAIAVKVTSDNCDPATVNIVTEADWTAVRAVKVDNADVAVSTRSTFAGGAVASVTAPVTAGTVTDKTDYALAVTPPTAEAIATYVWVTNVTGAAVAATLAGITSLANWLRGLYRKSSMNAVAKGEVNTGGGTYNEVTDSHEALAEGVDTVPTAAENAAAVVAEAFGDGEWPVELTVEDDNGDSVTGAILTFPGLAPQSTNTLGAFASAWALDTGTYAATLAVGVGYTATNPVTVTVNASGNVTAPTGGVIVVVARVVEAPVLPGQCRVYGWLKYPKGGGPVASVSEAVSATLIGTPVYDASGIGYEKSNQTADTEADGYFEIDLVRSSVLDLDGESAAKYRLRILAIGYDRVVYIPDELTVLFTALEAVAAVSP